jgi:hypothetical protein
MYDYRDKDLSVFGKPVIDPLGWAYGPFTKENPFLEFYPNGYMPW